MHLAKRMIAAVAKWSRRAWRGLRIFMHPFSLADAALCIDLRDWAALSGCLCYSMRTKARGAIAIFKDEVDACSDDWQLLAFVQARCNET